MIYPGLAHNSHFSRQGSSAAGSASRQWLTKNRFQMVPLLEPADGSGKVLGSTKMMGIPGSLTTYKARPETQIQYMSAKETSQLQAMAEDFRTVDFNLAKIFAEALVFLGLVLLNWSLELAKPQRVLALTKLALVVAFFALHPIYAFISASAIGLIYTYLKLSRWTKF